MIHSVTIKDVQKRIGEWCKEQRASHGLSQEQLADELALSRLTIQKLERGGNVTTDTLLKVVNHFGSLALLIQLINEHGNTSMASLY